jgi:hypothetical protein
VSNKKLHTLAKKEPRIAKTESGELRISAELIASTGAETIASTQYTIQQIQL